MMRDLAKILADYVENRLDPETEIEIDGLILRYVDGELDPESAAEIEAAMEANPAVAVNIGHSIAAAKTVQDQLVPAHDAVEMALDPEHDQWLAELIADPNAWGKEREEYAPADVVVPLQVPQKEEPSPAPRSTIMQPTWGMMVASIAVLLALGGGAHLYDCEGDAQRQEQIASLNTDVERLTEERDALAAESDKLTRQVTSLGIQLDDATDARENVTNQLAEAEASIERLNAEQVELSTMLTAANDEVTVVQAARNKLEQQIASLDAETRRTIEARVNERDALTRQLTTLEDGLDDAIKERDNVTKQLANANTEIEELNTDRAELAAQLAGTNEQITTAEAARDKLEQQIASLHVEKEATASQRAALETELIGLQDELAAALAAKDTVRARLYAEIKKGSERVIALENNLNQAKGEIAGLNQAGNMLLAETERLRKEGSWINQVVGYHRGYAGTMREVEVTAKQQQQKQMLTKWLGAMLGQEFTIPDLAGLDFVGGRVFFVNGMPTGQIAYHDQSGRLTAFCFSPAPSAQATALTKGEDGDLNLIYWEKEGLRYVLVGWADVDLLEPLATELQATYGEDA